MTQLVHHRTNDLLRNIRIDLAQVLQHKIRQKKLVSYLYVQFRQEVYPALLSYNSEQYNYSALAKP